jgi:methyl-accepting chemotaxis protein
MFERVKTLFREKLLAVPIGTVLAVILLLGLIPSFVMGGLYVEHGLSDIELLDKERKGVELVRQLKPVESFILDPAEDETTRKKQAAVNWTTVKSLANDPYYAQEIGDKAKWKSLQDALRGAMSGSDPAKIFRQYDQVLKQVGDASGLILDQQLDTYYLATISVNHAAELDYRASELEKAISQSGDASDPQVLFARHRLSDTLRQLQRAAYSASSNTQYALLEQNGFVQNANATIAAGNALNSADSDQIETAAAALRSANKKSWLQAVRALDRLLEQRRTEHFGEIWISLGISGAAAILVLLLAGTAIIAIATGVRSISDRLNDLAFGDYASPVPGTEYRNDIGVIANALQDFIVMNSEIEAERVRAKQELEETVAEVQRTNTVLMDEALEQQRNAADLERATLVRLANELEGQLSALLQGSRAAADKMDSEANTMAQRSADVKREASSASESASTIRHRMETVPSMVGTVARQLDAYAGSLNDANEIAADAAHRMEIANKRMSEFSDATTKAGSMLKIIQQVAQKTNMLALNAAIEAMRVGEAGKGFQVVANEVKALALSTRDAAAEIAEHIGTMEGANRTMADSFQDVMQAVDTLAAQSAKVVSGMSDQVKAIDSVERAVGEATSELALLVSSVEAADRSATSSQQRSGEMLSASVGVKDNVRALDQSVREFLGGIRNARNFAA